MICHFMTYERRLLCGANSSGVPHINDGDTTGEVYWYTGKDLEFLQSYFADEDRVRAVPLCPECDRLTFDQRFIIAMKNVSLEVSL